MQLALYAPWRHQAPTPLHLLPPSIYVSGSLPTWPSAPRGLRVFLLPENDALCGEVRCLQFPLLCVL